MQKDLTETPKRRIRRTRNAATPELPKKSNVNNISNSRAGSSRHRATMAPLDFLHLNTQKDLFPRRRVVTDRMSMLPSQMPSEGPRQVAVEPDNDSLQLELLYDEYLQGSVASELLVKETKETENKIVAELATIAKEEDYDGEKCFKLRSREVDIVRLSAAMYEVDSQIADVDSYIKNNKIKAFADALLQLYAYLQPLDILQCQNVILPTTAKEWSEIEEILKKCFITLQSIAELIGSKGEVYRDVYGGIKELIESQNEIEGYQKRIQKDVCNLQILVLKIASLSLKEDDDVIDI